MEKGFCERLMVRFRPGVSENEKERVHSLLLNHFPWLRFFAGTPYNSGSLNGTSMAACQVAGVAGLLWASSWSSSNESICARIIVPAEGRGAIWGEYGVFWVSAWQALASSPAATARNLELLAANQPWNLIIFMAIPVVLAETVAISELFILFRRDTESGLRKINRLAGTILGFYCLGIFIYLLLKAVIPITAAGEWRGPFDVIAVGSYLAGVVPLFGISLLELGLIARNKTTEQKMFLHAVFVGLFLAVAHIAMIFGHAQSGNFNVELFGAEDISAFFIFLLG
ncbi:MAG: hypothetical protein PWQ31_1247 [Eubacteriales bacterium]|nr:hypothetical protein [Eubacteriales bacterium]